MKILIIDDHPLMLDSIKAIALSEFPDAIINSVQTSSEAKKMLADGEWELVIVDLSIPTESGQLAKSENGIELLRIIMEKYPEQNLMVYSSNIKVLGQLKSKLDKHLGGLTIADKGEAELQRRMRSAVDGAHFTKLIKDGLELKPEWLDTLRLAAEGWQDKAIAEKLFVTSRAVRHYWTKLQDALEIYVEDSEKINLRVRTISLARERGLLD
jgi:DNA-binding NarL/FixJ family response regulator